MLNSDKSYQDDNDDYQNDASMSNTTVPGNNYSNTGSNILGPSVNTAGTITTIGFVNAAEMHSSVLFHTTGYLVAGPSNLIVNGSNVEITYDAGTILANSNITTLNGNINMSNGKLVLNSNTCGIVNMSTASVVGGFKKYLVTTSKYNLATSVVFCTLTGQGAPQSNGTNIISVENATSNSFNIVLNNTNYNGTIMWMLAN
jgi:hypothetical protein